MSGPAPVVAGGRLFISSGCGAFGLRPGNVLLAFGVSRRIIPLRIQRGGGSPTGEFRFWHCRCL